MKNTAGDSFADALNRAGRRPDISQQGANHALPNLFGDFPIPKNELVIDDEKASEGPQDGTLIHGVPRYRFRAHFRRFIMGTISIPTGAHEFDVEAHDDTAEYEALLNEMLSAKAVPRWEDRTTLKDGTVIIAVSYLSVLPKKENEGKRNDDE
jgi:hypothetical protein